MNATSNKKRWIAPIVLLLLLLSYVLYKRYHHPHARTGTTIIETDSTIIEVTVVESLDSAGNVQYETTRTVRPRH